MVAVVRAALAGEAPHGIVAELIVAAVAVLQPGEPAARAVVIAAGGGGAGGGVGGARTPAPPGLAEIEICYNPRNPVAGAFYGSCGFVETGRDDDGEDMLAVLPVTPPE